MQSQRCGTAQLSVTPERVRCSTCQKNTSRQLVNPEASAYPLMNINCRPRGKTPFANQTLRWPQQLWSLLLQQRQQQQPL
jgi:hypothetical protein